MCERKKRDRRETKCQVSVLQADRRIDDEKGFDTIELAAGRRMRRRRRRRRREDVTSGIERKR